MTSPVVTAGFLKRDGAYGGEWNVACPVCGGDYAHLSAINALRGSDPYEGTPVRGLRVEGVTSERRAAVQLIFDGECGHAWVVRFQQHKGHELVRVIASIGP